MGNLVFVSKSVVKVSFVVAVLLVFGVVSVVGTTGMLMAKASERTITRLQRATSAVKRW